MPLQECSGVSSLGIITFVSPGRRTRSAHRTFRPQTQAGISLWEEALARKLNEQGGELRAPARAPLRSNEEAGRLFRAIAP